MPKIDPKLILGAPAPASPDAYPVRIDFPIGAEDRDSHGSVGMDASRRWKESLLSAYLAKAKVTKLNYGDSFQGSFHPEDQAGVGCVSALVVIDEAQKSWSGNSRGDLLILRASFFTAEGVIRQTGVVHVIPTRKGTAPIAIDDATLQGIEAVEGHPVPRVKWTGSFKSGRGWMGWVSYLPVSESG